jgi:type IV secretory pathway component VirB8
MSNKTVLTHNKETYSDQDEIQNEYNNFIKESVMNGKYFKDGREWYIFKYITPICDRALLIISIFTVFIIIYMIQTIGSSMYPIKVSQAIFIPPQDLSLYQVSIAHIKPKRGDPNFDPEIQTFDESILKYLISNYIKNRESFDFRSGLVEDVNKKFNQIKSNSTFREYKNFQLIMSKNNKNSPIHNFGKNVKKEISINSIKFTRKEGRNAFEKALFYIANSPPLEADVDFTAITTSINDINEKNKIYERFLVKIKYDYQQIFKNDKQPSIGFNVNQYVLFRVKN